MSRRKAFSAQAYLEGGWRRGLAGSNPAPKTFPPLTHAYILAT
jgi:hypothetical protein